jgi:hypothetical protein
MATIEICDVCGTADGVQRRSYWVDRRMDAAGSMSDEHDVYDLCEKCELAVYKEIATVLATRVSKQPAGTVLGPLLADAIKRRIKQ